MQERKGQVEAIVSQTQLSMYSNERRTSIGLDNVRIIYAIPMNYTPWRGESR